METDVVGQCCIKKARRGVFNRAGTLIGVTLLALEGPVTVTLSRQSHGVAFPLMRVSLLGSGHPQWVSSLDIKVRDTADYVRFDTDPPRRVKVAADFLVHKRRHKERPMSVEPRPLHEVAKEIRREWRNPHFAAVPYIDAMAEMEDAWSKYGAEGGATIISYFLSNAASWRGEVAKRIKAELTAIRAMPKVVRETEEKMG